MYGHLKIIFKPKCNLASKGEKIKQVTKFKDLGYLITSDDRCTSEISKRKAMAEDTFQKMKPILANRNISSTQAPPRSHPGPTQAPPRSQPGATQVQPGITEVPARLHPDPSEASHNSDAGPTQAPFRLHPGSIQALPKSQPDLLSTVTTCQPYRLSKAKNFKVKDIRRLYNLI
ncbi:craniofacial development protein 2 [Plakobranchus ocellatus]|uniref:Craniofacial development protein 2 n=1 Tax=Plakobranchus ocellatus TaxID=259542 RepID=A0AAV3Y8W7_9GAST|nr:craniofacial development protein 2 [Plakobranchus ocellatus]